MAKLPFKTRLNCGSRRCSPVGSPVCDTYMDSVDDSGISCVVKSGESNFDDYIQSFKNDTDIYAILDRLTLSGSEPPAVLDEQFANVLSAPTNIHEAKKTIDFAKDLYDRLPEDMRSSYNNNFNEFIADFGSEKQKSLFVKNFVNFSNSDSNSVKVGDIDVERSE